MIKRKKSYCASLELKKICMLNVYKKVNSECEALVNATCGAVNVIVTDHRVYQKALTSEQDEVKKALVYSTLAKADILQTSEKEAGRGFVIEESLNVRKLNDLCWMAKFLRQSKNDLPSKDQQIYADLYAWIGAKEQTWLKKIMILIQKMS